jgi:hypothetical protein
MIPQIIKSHQASLCIAYKLQQLISLSIAFQIMKAARPVRKPRSEVLMPVNGDAALEELEADALEDVAEAVELPEAEAELDEPDDVEFAPGRVALPAALIPLAAS